MSTRTLTLHDIVTVQPDETRMTFRNEPFRFSSPNDAIDAMLAALALGALARHAESELIDASAGIGRILFADLRADRDSPSFDYSVVDGYAVRSTDFAPLMRSDAHAATQSPHNSFDVRVVGESRIGRAPPPWPTSLIDPVTIRISTGAPIPPGADLVIKREDVVEQETGAVPEAGASRDPTVAKISVPVALATSLKARHNIRFAGENCRSGDVVLRAGERLTSASLAALAAIGVARPPVFPRFRVAIISTGDELTPTDQTPSHFQIRDSNLPALASLFASRSWAHVVLASHVADDLARLVDELANASRAADAILLTGGVSMGHRDPVRKALEAAFGERLQVLFHGLPQRPGKPMLGAIVSRPAASPIPLFGLPGNPVSALATARRIAIPVLARCAGLAFLPPSVRIALAHTDERTLDLWWHRPVEIAPNGLATLIDLRGSGDLIACAHSHGFVEVPPNTTINRAGDDSPSMLEYFPWND